MQHPMNNTPNNIPGKKPIRNMFGDLKTQSWAREAFPILVNRAQNGQTLTFKELALDHFGVRGFMIFGSVCGIISATLYELEEEMGQRTHTAYNKYRDKIGWQCKQIRVQCLDRRQKHPTRGKRVHRNSA